MSKLRGGRGGGGEGEGGMRFVTKTVGRFVERSRGRAVGTRRGVVTLNLQSTWIKQSPRYLMQYHIWR